MTRRRRNSSTRSLPPGFALTEFLVTIDESVGERRVP